MWDLSLPQLSFQSQERILSERFQFIVLGRWDCGSLRFLWLPNEETSDDTLIRTPLLPVPLSPQPPGLGRAWESLEARAAEPKEGLGPSLYSALGAAPSQETLGEGASGGERPWSPGKGAGHPTSCPVRPHCPGLGSQAGRPRLCAFMSRLQAPSEKCYL